MADNATVNIPKDVLEPIIQANIAAALVQSLGAKQSLMEKAVADMLNAPVDENGQTPRYSSDKGTPWVWWALREVLKKAAKEAMEEYFKQHQQELKAQIAKELSRKNSPLAKQLAEGLVNAVSSDRMFDYRLNVTFENVR